MKIRFHECLARLRKIKGYTQLRMAEKLGIKLSAYINYEEGNESPDLETIVRISDILDCSLDELFGRDFTEKPSVQRPQEEKSSVGKSSVMKEDQTAYTVDIKRQKPTGRKLAIGVQDYRSLREKGGYYVDKTQMISEFMESEYQVTLLTRPRRFGKSLNMSMLAEFLDCTRDSADVFEGTKVCNSWVMEEMNGHPVISLSFLNVKGDTAETMLVQLMSAIEDEYYRYRFIMESEKLTQDQREKLIYIYGSLSQLKTDAGTESCLINAISILCQALMNYYEKKVYLLIDEYDTPFIAANAGGYYNNVRGILAGMLSSSLKGNQILEKAMLTGIQRVAKENIFSGLNNMTVCTVNDQEYSDCFGFTEEETKELLRSYGLELTEEVRDMYDGYLFGTTEVYNPWSVTFYAARKRLDPYWVNTSENSIIRNALEQSSESFIADYKRLIEEGITEIQLEMETSYYEQPDDASLWGLLVNAGMITAVEYMGDNYYTVRVPNYEVRRAFQSLTASYLKIQEGHISRMLRCLKLERMEAFAEEYGRVLLELPSYYDLKGENSYHMMMLGMCAFMYKDYEVKSNRESGTGRSDIILYAKSRQYPHMILEFKYAKEESQNLTELAWEAVSQIKEKHYDAGLDGKVYYIGLAHYGKRTEVRWESRQG